VKISDAVEKAMFVFLGWLLALLTTPIVEAIKRAYEVKQMRTGVLAELAELKYRMAIVAYYVAGKFGTRNHEFLKWAKPYIVGYSGPMRSDNVAKAVELQLSLAPEVLDAYLKTQRDEDKGISLKRYPIPYTSSKLDRLAWVSESVRGLLLEINTQIGILDAEADNAQYYFRMTFDEGISPGNRARIAVNLDTAYQNYARVGRNIADRVAELESAWV
jgi:hypothetical protein